MSLGGRWVGIVFALLGGATSGCELRPIDACPAAGEPSESGPLARGRQQLDGALERRSIEADVVITRADEPCGQAALASAGVILAPAPESYAIASHDGRTVIVGRDSVGAMYGAFELAERIDLDGASALDVLPIAAAPGVPFRASNLFVVMKDDAEPSWWFLEDRFWEEYLDILARARINVLDMHGMYNLKNTFFPNVLLHFGSSPSFPDVGIAAAERARNLDMLRRVVAMAADRGIRVGLMSYHAGTTPTGEPEGPVLSEDDLLVYTREAAGDIALHVPGLWGLGFRIGESGRAAEWYEASFVAGVEAAATGVQPYTRTWVTSKNEILALTARTGADTVVQAKYNGEQLGPPYVIAGGLMSKAGEWPHYSYENYLEAPAPYRFVYQIRAGGTHRIFRHASFERTRRLAPTTLHGGAVGFTLEPPHAYYPQYDYYHAEIGDRFSEWTFRRDELMYLLYGRLAYDFETPSRVFEHALAARVGTTALWGPLQAASEIVPWIQTVNTCGPDHRHFAPELELAGPVSSWAAPSSVPSAGGPPAPGGCQQAFHGPFDTFAFALPSDAAEDLVAGRPTARVSPVEVARRVLEAAAAARQAAAVDVQADNAEARDVVRECVALADLGDWFGHKLRAAVALAVYERSGAADYLAAARSEMAIANAAWRALAEHTRYIKPFLDMLRMDQFGLRDFHWERLLDRLADEHRSIEDTAARVAQARSAGPAVLPPAADFLGRVRGDGPGLAALEIEPPDPSAARWKVSARFTGQLPSSARVRFLSKPFSGLADWQAPVDAAGDGVVFSAEIEGTGAGALFAVEVAADVTSAWRYPDVLRETPYVTLPPLRAR